MDSKEGRKKKKKMLLDLFLLSETSGTATNTQLLSSYVELIMQLKKKRRKDRNRVKGFFDSVIPMFALDEYKCHFRMSRITFEAVYQELCTVVWANDIKGLKCRSHGGGNKQINLERKLIVFIWFLVTKETYREISNLFGIAESCCCGIIHKMAKVFVQHILQRMIRWPTENEKVEISAAIEESKGFPSVIGMLDGCHIPIKRPTEGGCHYYNRKEFYSIILQAVCREDMRFTDIFVGYPGRVHDARVFRSSPLFDNGVTMCGHFLLLADSAYPNLGWLLTPFRRNQRLTPNMVNYNTVHSSVRTTIERAFGILKGRFRRLQFVDQHSAETMSLTTVAACVLHNICILQEDVDVFLEEDSEVPVPILPPGIFNNDGRERGVIRRNAIMQRLRRN